MARSTTALSTDSVAASGLAWNVNQGTFACWANPNFSSGDSTRHYLIDVVTGSVDEPSFQRFTDNNLYMGFANPGRVTIADTGLLTAGTWGHWAFTYAPGGQTAYKNGVSVGTASGIAPFVPGNGITMLNTQSGIGAFAFGSGADFAVWNVVLTSTELSALARGIRPNRIRPLSLIGYWQLEGNQSPEPDLSGLAHNGTLTGTALTFGPPIMPYTPRWSLFTSAPSLFNYPPFQLKAA